MFESQHSSSGNVNASRDERLDFSSSAKRSAKPNRLKSPSILIKKPVPSAISKGATFDAGADAARADHLSPVPRANSGFLKVSFEGLTEIASKDLGYQAMAACLVLAGGVDNKVWALARATGHGAKSIHERAMIGYKAAERAIKTLKEHGFLQEIPAGVPISTFNGVGKPIWQVDPLRGADLAIDQRFLRKPDYAAVDIDERPRLGTLAHLLHFADVTDDIDKRRTIVDALLVFAAMHKHQEFDTFAGVNPALLGSRCCPIKSGEDGLDTEHIVRLDDFTDEMALITEHSPDEVGVDADFAQSVLGKVSWTGAPSVTVRFTHALRQLERSGLCYRVHVVWNVDPIAPPDNREAEVLYTLHVARSWSKSMERGVADCIHSKFCLSTPEERHARFADSRGTSPNWHRSSIFRFAVPQRQARDACLTVQYRARWWPLHGSTAREFEHEQARNEDWRRRFEQCIRVHRDASP
jgi:hypothetical protein